jgi:hypothetical protein
LFKTAYNLNTPTLDEVWKDKKDKWDIDKTFHFGEIVNCGEWIIDDMKQRLENFIIEKENKNNK